MKKIYFVIISLFFVAFTYAQEWNFSGASFNSLGNVATTTTVDDLTIYADAEKDVDIGTNNKSIDGYSFTYRLKLNGSGSWTDDTNPRGRVLSVPVTGSGTITVYGMSSSSSAIRTLNVTAGDKTTLVGEFTTGGEAIDKATFSYSGGANTLYFYSASSGFNVYLLKFDLANSIDKAEQYKEVVKEEYYSINGLNYGDDYESLKYGVYIKRITYNDGSVKAIKVLKSDR